MELDLGRLKDMHPLLSLSTARAYAYHAAVGLERHGHRPGAILSFLPDAKRQKATLQWPLAACDGVPQLDVIRVTEEAAEAITLALVHVARGWTVRRRLQRGESADWLLIDGDRNLVALEVSGVDTEDSRQRRLKEKAVQVGRCGLEAMKVASVVELRPPRCRTRTV